MKISSPAVRVVFGLVKVVAIAVGFATTALSLMSLVGLATDNGWARGAVALIVAVGVPMFIADRLLPGDDAKPAPGLVSDVFSLLWLGFGLVFACALHGTTGPWLAQEGDRLAVSGHGGRAAFAYALAGLNVSYPQPVVSREPASSAVAATSDAPPPPAAPASAISAPVDAGAPPATTAAAPPQAPDAGAKLGRDRSPAELFQELAPSVVTIFVKGPRGEGSGTGFLVDGEGTIATNHHVVAGGATIILKFQGGAQFEAAELLADSEPADLALLRVDLNAPRDGGAPPQAKPLSLGDSDAVVVGERAISIGNPLGLEHTLTDGLVSARRIYENRSWIQMSVPVSPGNSGGPIFNMRGEVIGITTQQVLGGMSGRAQNLNLAVPINELKKLITTSYPARRKFGEPRAAGHW